MSDAAPVSVRLDLDPAADPIRGTLTVNGREPDEFVGWLGLAAAIEPLIVGAESSDRREEAATREQ